MNNATMISAIQNAIGAHGKWKFNLKIAITTGRSEFDVHKVSCNDQCDFGKWLYSPAIDEETRMGKPYEVITRLHTEFHKTAANVLKLALQNQKEAANVLLEGEFNDRSAILVKALNKWKSELI